MSARQRSGVTISDVAAAAGVSRQTVSNVLNAPTRVSPDTAARVRRAIDDLRYRPNRVAQRLREQASRCVGFKINPPAGVSNLLDRFLHALAGAADAVGYHVLLFAPATIERELAGYEDLVRTGTVDGFVLADMRRDDPRLPWFAERRIPLVCFGRPEAQARVRASWVDVDGAYGTARAVDHLVSRGHRRIAYLGLAESTGFWHDRRAGWRTAMDGHGLATAGLSEASADDVTSAAEAAGRLLAGPTPPSAFVCGSDTFAVGARLAGGTDASGAPRVEVVGFDDSPAATLMSPPMSSVRQPVEEVARTIMGLFVARLHQDDAPPEGVMLRPELVAREWHRPPPAR